MNDSRRRLGFTLIELLVVILIVGILVGITLPAIQRVRESARRTSCMNQVRQCTLAVLNFETSHRQLPSAISTENDIYPLQSWLQKILPFLEREAIYRQAVSDYRSNRSPFEGHVGMQTVVSNFHCPSEPNSGEAHWTHQDLLVASTNYLGVSGLNWQSEDGVLYKDSSIRVGEISDGLSNTLLMGERPPSPDFWFGWWYSGLGQQNTGSGDMHLGVREMKAPGTDFLDECQSGPHTFKPGQRSQCDVLHYWSYHPGGSVFSKCDGSVQFISYEQDNILPSLASRSDGLEAFSN